MINLDTIIKYTRAISRDSWPALTRDFLKALGEVKQGFPGIGNDHLSLVSGSDLKGGDIFIFSLDLLGLPNPLDIPAIMYRLDMTGDMMVIEGIGQGRDLEDPDRLLRRWGDTMGFEPIPCPVLRVDVRPTMNGGPGYYYFFKSYRDFRN